MNLSNEHQEELKNLCQTTNLNYDQVYKIFEQLDVEHMVEVLMCGLEPFINLLTSFCQGMGMCISALCQDIVAAFTESDLAKLASQCAYSSESKTNYSRKPYVKKRIVRTLLKSELYAKRYSPVTRDINLWLCRSR